MRKLLVIGEPNIIANQKATRNNALNLILKEYASFFEEVYYLGPTDDDNTEAFVSERVHYYPLKGYSKNIFIRFRFYLFTFLYKKNIMAIIDEIKPDLIQVRIPSFFSNAVYKIIKKNKIPVTSYIAGEWDEALKLNYGNIPCIRFIAKKLFNTQKEIVKNTIPVCTGDLLKTRFLSVNRNCYAYYSTTHNEVKRKKTIAFPAYRILCVGRLEKLKRNEDAIYALSYLVRYSEKYFLTFIGDGIEKENLIRLVDELGLGDKVAFLGHISDKDKLAEIFESNDILLHTSLSEGTTKVLPEAMSYGLLPIAIKDVGSNNYILASDNGYLVEQKNPENIARCIDKYNNLTVPAAEKIIDNCYKYAEEHTISQELNSMWEHIFNNINKI